MFLQKKSELDNFSMYWPKRFVWRGCSTSGKSIGWATAFSGGTMDYCFFCFYLLSYFLFFESSLDLCSRYLQIQVSTGGCPYPPQTTANQLLWVCLALRRKMCPEKNFIHMHFQMCQFVSLEVSIFVKVQWPAWNICTFPIKLLFLPALIHWNIFLSWAITSQKRRVKGYFTAYSSFKCSSFK